MPRRGDNQRMAIEAINREIGWTTGGLARSLGLTRKQTVIKWIHRGMLKARRKTVDGKWVWVIRDDAVIEMLNTQPSVHDLICPGPDWAKRAAYGKQQLGSIYIERGAFLKLANWSASLLHHLIRLKGFPRRFGTAFGGKTRSYYNRKSICDWLTAHPEYDMNGKIRRGLAPGNNHVHP